MNWEKGTAELEGESERVTRHIASRISKIRFSGDFRSRNNNKGFSSDRDSNKLLFVVYFGKDNF